MAKSTSPAPVSVVPARADGVVSLPAWLCVAAAAALTLWIVLTTLNVIRTGWVAIPVADDWDRWITLMRDHYGLGWFFAEHVDHRLVIARLFFTVDHLAFDGRGWFLIISSVVIQLVSGWMLWRLAGRAYPQHSSERLMQGLVVVCCVLSAQQWVNFIWPFQVQFPLVYCAAAGALYALWKATEQNWSRGWLAGSMALAVVATYSMANGILVWLVMLIAAFWLGMPRKWMAAIGAGWVLVGVAYFYGWHSFTASRMGTIERLPRMLVFWPGHLGSPMYPLSALARSYESKLAVGVVAGTLLAIVLLAGFIALWRRREHFNNARAILLFYCVFLAITSGAMAYGRSPFDLIECYSPRYLTPSYLFWSAMLLWTWPWLRRFLSRNLLYAGLCAAILTGIAIHQRVVLHEVRDRENGERLGEVAIVNNVLDPEPWHWLFHTPAMTLDTIQALRAQHLTVFTEEWTHWPGIPVDRRFTIDRTPGACQGQFEQTIAIASPQRPGWRATGWAWDNKAKAAPRYIILADGDGQVAGVALGGFPQPREFDALSQQHSATVWNGYVTGNPRPITAYVLEADNRSLCAIGTKGLQRAGAEVAFNTLGIFLQVSNPEISGAIVPDGYFKGQGSPGRPPVDGPVYGSFPDGETGSVRMGPFHLDGRTGIAVPVVTGPETHGLLLQVRDAATKEVLAQMDPPPVRTTWWAWRPDLPEGKELNLEIVAEDKGKGWGQWIAVAWPHALKP
jgi:hypothetical protein